MLAFQIVLVRDGMIELSKLAMDRMHGFESLGHAVNVVDGRPYAILLARSVHRRFSFFFIYAQVPNVENLFVRLCMCVCVFEKLPMLLVICSSFLKGHAKMSVVLTGTDGKQNK